MEKRRSFVSCLVDNRSFGKDKQDGKGRSSTPCVTVKTGESSWDMVNVCVMLDETHTSCRHNEVLVQNTETEKGD